MFAPSAVRPMRIGILAFTALPLLIFVLNLINNSPQYTRRLRVAVSSAQHVAAAPAPARHAAMAPSHWLPPPPSPPAASLSLSPIPSPTYVCNGTAHVELWGSLVQSGTENDQPTASDCCKSCREYEPTLDVNNGAQCNAWVWNPASHECWLKHQRPGELKHAIARVQQPGDPKVVWYSGVNLEVRPCADCTPPSTYTGCISKDVCNTSRACGSPAVGAYSKIPQGCMERSPTALRYAKALAAGTPLIGFTDLAADYDGLGVRWGIGHKKERWEDCEEACRAFNRGALRGGPFRGLPCNTWTWCSQKVRTCVQCMQVCMRLLVQTRNVATRTQLHTLSFYSPHTLRYRCVSSPMRTRTRLATAGSRCAYTCALPDVASTSDACALYNCSCPAYHRVWTHASTFAGVEARLLHPMVDFAVSGTS